MGNEKWQPVDADRDGVHVIQIGDSIPFAVRWDAKRREFYSWRGILVTDAVRENVTYLGRVYGHKESPDAA